MSAPFFLPTFGNRPTQIIGRDSELAQLEQSLLTPKGSRERCTLILGQRGMGKTALLLELEDIAKQNDYVVARVSHNQNMLDEIVELIQINGEQYISQKEPPIKGLSAGALGFSLGLTFTEETKKNYGFRVQLGLLCDRLLVEGKRILILVDEARTSENMRQLATTYQNLVGDGKDIAICMAGLPSAISSILNDKVLTFLNRAQKMKLTPISSNSIRAYYASAFEQLGIAISKENLDEAAERTQGFPYLMQLLGYYLVQYASGTKEITSEVIQEVERSALDDLSSNVFAPILTDLSQRDLELLNAIAACDEVVSTASLRERLSIKDSELQPYRARLIDAGVVESPRRGELSIAVPYLREYLYQRELGI